MAKQPTPPALYGYEGQPPTYTLKDGRELPAGDLVARAVADYRELNKGLNWTEAQAAESWNAMQDGVRRSFLEDTLEEVNEELTAGAAAIDAANVMDHVGDAAAKALGEELIDAALAEVKALERPWHQMTADQQDRVLERITVAVRAAVGDTIRMLATQGAPHLVCELEQITVKKGAKAVLAIPKGELDQDLLDAVGQSVILVVGPALQDAKGIAKPKAEPDQADLLGQAHLGNGDNGLVQHSDPED